MSPRGGPPRAPRSAPPPPRASSRPPPPPAKPPLIDRASSVAQLLDLLATQRWVTVCGPPGVGKSRLADEVTARSRDAAATDLATDDNADHDDAWHKCDLGEVQSADALFIAVAARLEVPLGSPSAGRFAQVLAAALRSRGPTFLWLDNGERLDDDATQTLSDWLDEVPDLWILVTSRRALRGAGEVAFDLHPLDLGAEGDGPSPAAQLFLERARARRHSFHLGDGDLARVEAIVRSVDGLPLAIELAAAHVGALGLEEIQRHLTTSAPALLAARTVGTAPRHASLDAALRRSWDLLSPEEQASLAALSVFSGAFDLEDAEGLLRTYGGAVAQIAALCDASLVARREATDGRSRLQLLGVVRSFAGRALDASGERDAAEQGHAEAMLGRCDRGAIRPGDLPDLEAALLRLCGGASPADVEAGVQIALAVDDVLSVQGPLPRRMDLLEVAVAAANRVQLVDARLGRLLLARASASLDRGDLDESLRDRERAMALAEQTGDAVLGGQALEALARHAWHEGQVERARALFEEAIAVQRAAGGGAGTGRALMYLGNALAHLGRSDEARARYEEALPALRRARDCRGTALVLGNLADLDADRGWLDLATRRCAEAIELAARCGDRASEACFLTNLAAMSLERGAVGEARVQLDQAIERHEALGHARWTAIALGYRGRCWEREGDAARATALYDRALALHAELGNALFVGLVSVWSARLLARRGAFADARHVLAEAEAALVAGQSGWRDLVPIVRMELESLAGAAGDAEALVTATRRVHALQAASPETLGAEVRMALAELGAVRVDAPAASAPTSLCVVSRSARWFQLAGEPAVSLQTRRALHLVLAALARAHEEQAGRALPWAEVLEAGWPGERVHPTAGSARVYTAVATLRRMGLRWVLLRRDDGYLLDPSLRLERAEDDAMP